MRFLPFVLFPACAPVAAPDTMSCGPGTHADGGVCVADAVDTGTDTGDTGTDTDTGGDTDTDTGDTGTGDTDTGADSGDTGDTDTGASWTVCAGGGAPFTEIQDAVDVAADGAVITVCAGTYDYVEVYRAELTLIGEDRDTTIITGGSHTALFVDTTTIDVSGFTLSSESRDTGAGAALHLVDSTAAVTDMRFADTTGSYVAWQDASEVTWSEVLFEDNHGSLLTGNGGSMVLRNSVFRNNQPNGGSGGSLLAVGGLDYEVSNNLFYDNEIAMNAGGASFDAPRSLGWVYNNVWWRNDHHGAQSLVYGATGVLIENNIVAKTTGGGLMAYTPRDGILYNAAYDNSGDDFPRNDGTGVPSGNLGDDCRLKDPASGDFSLTAGFSPCVDVGDPLSGYNDPDGTRNDLGAFGGPHGNWTPP